MTTIKIKTFKFISVRPIHYILFILAILIVVLFTAVTIANTIQLSMLISDIQTLRAEQEYISALIEGQALPQERTDTMALAPTGRVFSIDRYRQWHKTTCSGIRVPDWVHACNGQPILKENGITDVVRGLDGEYHPSAPEWEVTAPAACLRA